MDFRIKRRERGTLLPLPRPFFRALSGSSLARAATTGRTAGTDVSARASATGRTAGAAGAIVGTTALASAGACTAAI